MIDCEEFFTDPVCQVPPQLFSSFERGLFAGREQQLGAFLDLGPESCHLHDDDDRRVVCLECRAVVCVRCLLDGGHRSHLWSDLDDVIAQFQRFAGLDDVSVSGFVTRGVDRKRRLVEEKADFLREVASSEQAIAKAGQGLKTLVDRHTDALIDELSQLKMRKLGEIENDRQEVEKELKILELCYEEIAQQRTLADGYVTKSAFAVTAASDNDLDPALTPSPESSCHTAAMIAFQEADILEQLKANDSNLLGRLRAEFDLRDQKTVDELRGTLRLIDFPDESVGFKSSTAETEQCHVTAQLTAMLDTGGSSVFGVAAMNGRLFALLSNSILVFGAQGPSFDLIEEIKVRHFLYPFDLAASPFVPCLYVADDGHRCLWRVDDDKDHGVTRFLDGVGEPSTISVSLQTGHVTLLRSGQPSVLEVVDADGQSVSVVALPDDVIEPQHAVVTSSGETVVCFRQRNRKVWCVCLFDRQGNVSVRCELRDALHHLAATPCHLALDEFDRVFVADWQRKVDLFDPELNWDRTLLSSQRDGIERPERICYDRVNRLLLVVHGWGKKTYVYRYNARHLSHGASSSSRW